MSDYDINEFEQLLRRRDANPDYHVVERINKLPPERLVADKSASIDDFIIMLSKIICKVMKKQKVEFKPDEGARLTVDQAEKLDHPYIMFRILDSHPRLEIKPRVRETPLKGLDGQEKEFRRTGDIWGQFFTCEVQFDILATSYQEATETMDTFIDTVFTYTAHFKKNGVKDIRFSRRFTDSNLDIYRQKCSIRSIQYTIEIEKLFTRFYMDIEGINII